MERLGAGFGDGINILKPRSTGTGSRPLLSLLTR